MTMEVLYDWFTVLLVAAMCAFALCDRSKYRSTGELKYYREYVSDMLVLIFIVAAMK